jgi:hypothetical protein
MEIVIRYLRGHRITEYSLMLVLIVMLSVGMLTVFDQLFQPAFTSFVLRISTNLILP